MRISKVVKVAGLAWAPEMEAKLAINMPVIKKEIPECRFLKDPSFAGKVCRIRIQLERDGTISGYHESFRFR